MNFPDSTHKDHFKNLHSLSHDSYRGIWQDTVQPIEKKKTSNIPFSSGDNITKSAYMENYSKPCLTGESLHADIKVNVGSKAIKQIMEYNTDQLDYLSVARSSYTKIESNPNKNLDADRIKAKIRQSVIPLKSIEGNDASLYKAKNMPLQDVSGYKKMTKADKAKRNKSNIFFESDNQEWVSRKDVNRNNRHIEAQSKFDSIEQVDINKFKKNAKEDHIWQILNDPKI